MKIKGAILILTIILLSFVIFYNFDKNITGNVIDNNSPFNSSVVYEKEIQDGQNTLLNPRLFKNNSQTYRHFNLSTNSYAENSIQITSKKGEMFLIMTGRLKDPTDNSKNKFLYMNWTGGENTLGFRDYKNYEIQDGDVLSYYVFDTKEEGCGMEIEFKNKQNLSESATDQNKIGVLNANPNAYGQWYERRIDLSDFKGETIDKIMFVQENDVIDDKYFTEGTNNGFFRCFFDDVYIGKIKKILSNTKDIKTQNLNQSKIKIRINNENLNLSEEYSGEKNLKILEENKTLLEFNWNFTNKELNLSKIEIKKQNISSNYGYLIVNGLNISKTLRIDKLYNNSNSVCIKDQEISSINYISNNCNSTNEYLIKCNSIYQQGFKCEISGSQFIVSNLSNSAVKEITNCERDWDCIPWGNCINGIQTRACIDLNSCGTTPDENRKNETQTCCTPNWDCTEWSPETCPKEEKQTRTCTDSNNCGITTGKPSETKTCEYKGFNWLWIIIPIIIILGISLTAFVIIYFSKKSENQNSNQFKIQKTKSNSNVVDY